MTLSENKSVLETAKPPKGGLEIVGPEGFEPVAWRITALFLSGYR